MRRAEIAQLVAGRLTGAEATIAINLIEEALAADRGKLTVAQYVLTCLIEECAEVQQRATKALRFGLHEIQPGQELHNETRLTHEVTDLLAVLELLHDENVRVLNGNRHAIVAKKYKVREFMEYSREQGTLEETDG